jgi:hypothetical protein
MPARRALFALFALGLAAACSETETEPALTAETVVLFPDDPGRTRLGALRYTGGVALESSDDRFGGWSAVEISEEGARLLTLSDRANWMTARLVYAEDGALVGLSEMTIAPLLDAEGRALDGDAVDAEGLAPLGGGRYAVSFERQHRIEAFDLGDDWSGIGAARGETLPAPPGADRLRNNAGMEALARSGEILWAGVEYPLVEGQPHTLWRFDLSDPDAPPQARSLSLTPGFGLTALASDGEGGLYIVERFWARNIGNRIRIGQLSAEDLNEGAQPAQPTLLAEITPDMTVDNIEAIAVIEIAGETRLFLMSDDNFNAAQRTLLLSFVIEA